MAEASCDKGPILDTLLEKMHEVKQDQRKMVDALVSIAQHQERLVSLADKTEENKTNIGVLFQLQREYEAHSANSFKDIDQKLTNHLVNHPSQESCKASGLLQPNSDGKFDKIQITVIVAFIMFAASVIWEFVRSSLAALKSIVGCI